MKQVIVSVIGGVADIAYASKGVKVSIVDFDNAEAEGESGVQKLQYCVARAKCDEKNIVEMVDGDACVVSCRESAH